MFEAIATSRINNSVVFWVMQTNMLQIVLREEKKKIVFN